MPRGASSRTVSSTIEASTSSTAAIDSRKAACLDASKESTVSSSSDIATVSTDVPRVTFISCVHDGTLYPSAADTLKLQSSGRAHPPLSMQSTRDWSIVFTSHNGVGDGVGDAVGDDVGEEVGGGVGAAISPSVSTS